MGKGGSVPNAPDMSKQIGAAQGMTSTATDNASQVMNTAKGYNNNAQNTLSTVTGAQTPLMQQVGNTATSNLNNYGSTFQPLQKQQADFAQNWGSDANVAAQQGKAVADTSAAFDAQRRNSAAALASEGVDPASIHGNALDAQSRVQQAGAESQASTAARTNTQLQGQQLVAGANQLGLQVGSAGDTGAATASGIGSSAVQNTNQTNATGVNNLTAANTYLNTGVNANASAANIQNTQFQDQLAQQQAQQAQGASTLSSIGSIAGAAAMFMEDGGPVPGQNYAEGIPTRHSGQPVLLGAPVSRAYHYDHGGPVSTRGALPVSPIPGSTDTKPAFLTPGEFVLPHDVAAWKGHEHWYKQIDKAREEMSKRHGIPPHVSSVHTARGV